MTDLEKQRDRIDEIDAEIAQLIIRRRQRSQSLQRAKVLNGQSPVDISREREVINHYRLILGHLGVHIGTSILQYSKETVVH